MIVRVWGIVNSTEVEFTPVPNRPDYWEGLAPRVDGLQEIEIWAENDKGARGHLECTVQVQYHTHTTARLLLMPYVVRMVKLREISLQAEKYLARFAGCREVV